MSADQETVAGGPADWKPALARSVTLRHDRVRDVDLLLMPEQAVVLSGEAGTILRLCDGNRTAEQIIAELVEQFPGGPVAGDVTGFLNDIKEEGWLR
jgi:pyrroloquinoline quinone biosynthesis protein D